MTTAPAASSPPAIHYLNAEYGIWSWLFTKDHKRIALLYLFSITCFFALGGVFAVAIRLELATPAGDLVSSDVYNRLFTMHGIVMIFFFLIPSIPATLGNFLIPMMVGARDLAFPKLNLLSWYLFNIGGLLMLWTVLHGGVDTGWTFYTPFSTRYATTYVTEAALGIFISGFSSILTGLNFIVTIHRMRAPGLTWGRLPLFVWSHYATSLVIVLGTPVVAITLLLVAAERVFRIGIFDPAIGGDPVLFQHMFWFYSHPAVYIMVLPSMGVVSEIVATFAHKPVFGYRVVAVASLAIALLGFLVWGHHMFVSGQSALAALAFSLLSMMVAVPSAIKVFNWTATLYRGSIAWDTPLLYAMGFIGLFTMGGLTGVMVATLGIDIHVHDTYFVVAHFHYIMVGGALMGFLGGLHYWWPKITGRLYPRFWSRLSALIVFVGFNITFLPQFVLGYQGMPRRYHAYPAEMQVLNVMSSAGATILGLGYVIPLIYLLWSMRYGERASDNPWGSAGFEWATSSPPPTENFHETPVIDRGPYGYPHSEGVPGGLDALPGEQESGSLGLGGAPPGFGPGGAGGVSGV
ncbi:MAG: cytochrome c oxidase subunit I [Polyangiaceae bacterium]